MILLDQKRIPIVEAHQTGKGFLIESDSGSIRPEMNGFHNKNFKYEKDKPVILKCILQKAFTLNKNGRIYPKNLIERELKKYQKYIDNMSAVGEADHPDNSNISLHNLSHRLIKAYWQGDTLYGDIEILPSRAFIEQGIVCMPGDKILRYLELGVIIGISSRALGSVQEVNGTKVVQDDFELICFDLVVTPSTPNAYLFKEEEVKLDEAKKDKKPMIFNSIKLKNILNESKI